MIYFAYVQNEDAAEPLLLEAASTLDIPRSLLIHRAVRYETDTFPAETVMEQMADGRFRHLLRAKGPRQRWRESDKNAHMLVWRRTTSQPIPHPHEDTPDEKWVINAEGEVQRRPVRATTPFPVEEEEKKELAACPHLAAPAADAAIRRAAGWLRDEQALAHATGHEDDSAHLWAAAGLLAEIELAVQGAIEDDPYYEITTETVHRLLALADELADRARRTLSLAMLLRGVPLPSPGTGT